MFFLFFLVYPQELRLLGVRVCDWIKIFSGLVSAILRHGFIAKPQVVVHPGS
jgi:hypothetical protein